LGLVLDACRQIPLIEYLSLGNDRVSQLDRRVVQEYHLNATRLHGECHLMREPGTYLPNVRGTID
jgi:hypothetical protein